MKQWNGAESIAFIAKKCSWGQSHLSECEVHFEAPQASLLFPVSMYGREEWVCHFGLHLVFFKGPVLLFQKPSWCGISCDHLWYYTELYKYVWDSTSWNWSKARGCEMQSKRMDFEHIKSLFSFNSMAELDNKTSLIVVMSHVVPSLELFFSCLCLSWNNCSFSNPQMSSSWTILSLFVTQQGEYRSFFKPRDVGIALFLFPAWNSKILHIGWLSVANIWLNSSWLVPSQVVLDSFSRSTVSSWSVGLVQMICSDFWKVKKNSAKGVGRKMEGHLFI